MADQVERIIIRAEGEERVRRLSSAIEAEEQNLRQLISTLGRHDAATRASAHSIAEMQQQLRAASRESGVASNRLMTLGQTFDDLQYVPEQGLRPIIGNIMQLSPALGIAMIALNPLINNFGKLMELFGQGHTKTQAQEMEELGKKTEKTAEETARLLEYETQRKNLAAQNAPSKAMEDQAQAINEAIRDAPAAGVRAAIDQLHGTQLRNAIDPAIEQQLRQSEADLKLNEGIYGAEEARTGAKFGPLEEARENARKAREAYDAAYIQKRDQFQAGLASDPARFSHLVGEIEDKKLLTPEARERLKAATPEARKQSEADAKFADADDLAMSQEADARQLAREQRDRRREARKKRIDAAKAKAHQGAASSDFADRLNKEDFDRSKQLAAEKLKRDKEGAPGIEGLIRSQLIAMGGSDRAAADLQERLKGRFGSSTHALVAGQLGAAREQLMSDFIKGPEGQKRRNSQVIGAEALANSIQSAVGGEDVAKKSFQELQRQTMLLTAIANQRPGGPARFNAAGQLAGGD